MATRLERERQADVTVKQIEAALWVTLNCCFGSSTVNENRPISEKDISGGATFTISPDKEHNSLQAQNGVRLHHQLHKANWNLQ